MTTRTYINEDAALLKYVTSELEKGVDETVKRVTEKYKKLAHEELNREINKEKVKIALSISKMFDVEFDSHRVVINMKMHNENDKRIN